MHATSNPPPHSWAAVSDTADRTVCRPMDLYQQLIVPFAARLELERLPLVDSDDHESVIEAGNLAGEIHSFESCVLSYIHILVEHLP